MSCKMSKLADFILKARDVIVFTGAGISTESGISDYRGKGGLWERFRPVTIQEFTASEDKRREYWRTKAELYSSLENVKPNKGHWAIAEFEKINKLKGLITQNIDGLHQLAGISTEKILELHGSNRKTVCLTCQDITDWQETYQRLRADENSPRCLKCHGLLKPNTISFGQSLNRNVLNKAAEWSRNCDLFLAVGSTLIVEPAASLPRIAKEHGACLVILTLSSTPLDQTADLKIEAPIGETFDSVLEIIRNEKRMNLYE